VTEIEPTTRRYPTDLTDEDGLGSTPCCRPGGRTGGKRSVDLREILNAIRYVARSGEVWRMLPKDFPPWQTVCWWLRSFVRHLLLRIIDDNGADDRAGPVEGRSHL
jgi:putative transposase